MREEIDIFADLAQLCSSVGYAHAIAHICFRDNIIGYADKMTPDVLLPQFSMERLVRTEISTLIGLMFKESIDFSLPEPKTLQTMLEKTDSLLKEIHHSMMAPMIAGLNPAKVGIKESNPFAHGPALREPIFYGGESAYNFQYRDFFSNKYAKDNCWLETNKGFSVESASKVISCVGDIQNEKILSHLKTLKEKGPSSWSMLPAFILSCEEIAVRLGIDKSLVKIILKSFVPPEGMRNQDFNALNDFNVTNAYPLIDLGNDEFLLFQNYGLVEALYETPFYWMISDRTYINEAMKNRGDFTEEFSVERLEVVFGKNRVFSNVSIIDSKKQTAGEIDVLVVFADRVIILQAKSKRLTLESRKGNDSCIKDDFKKSIQDSYDQGLMCAKLLADRNYKLIDASSNELYIRRNYKETYIFCIVADHYPALSFQTRQFLKYEQTESIMPPFVMDIFLLDVMTEMLQSPLHFLSYVNRRSQYVEKVYASHELTVLAYHLKQNLWIDSEYHLFQLGDDICADLDVAMMVRREGVPGESTPKGILTRFENTAVSNLLRQIEKMDDPGAIDLGFMILTLNEETMLQISKGLKTIVNLALQDKQHHDLTIGISEGNIGLTIHCNNDPLEIAAPRLNSHCERRKYSQKATDWFGICLNPINSTFKFGLKLEFPWEKSDEMESIVKDLPKGRKIMDFRPVETLRRKVGRNEPCPCGSGIKYKKCCIDG